MYFDASCNENGPNLSLDPAPCFLVPIIVKCNKFVTVEAQTLLDYGTLACFIDKELVQQFKLAHTSKIIFNVISFLRNLIIIGLFWLVLHSPQMD